MEEKIFFHSADKTKLCGVWTPPERPATKAIILAHGITVDKDEHGIFSNLASLLAQNGFAVFRFDFRAHGESEGNTIDLTLSGEIQDIESAFALVQKKGFQEINFLGASFGGGISVLFAARHEKEISRLCLWNPVINYDHCYLHPTLPSILKRKAHIPEDLGKKGWTTVYGKDFKLGKPLFDEMARFFPYKEILKLRLPVCIIHGDKDTKVPYEDSKEAAESKPDIEFVTIENADHGFHDLKEDAEMANQATLNFFQKTL